MGKILNKDFHKILYISLRIFFSNLIDSLRVINLRKFSVEFFRIIRLCVCVTWFRGKTSELVKLLILKFGLQSPLSCILMQPTPSRLSWPMRTYLIVVNNLIVFLATSRKNNYAQFMKFIHTWSKNKPFFKGGQNVYVYTYLCMKFICTIWSRVMTSKVVLVLCNRSD